MIYYNFYDIGICGKLRFSFQYSPANSISLIPFLFYLMTIKGWGSTNYGQKYFPSRVGFIIDRRVREIMHLVATACLNAHQILLQKIVITTICLSVSNQGEFSDLSDSVDQHLLILTTNKTSRYPLPFLYFQYTIASDSATVGQQLLELKYRNDSQSSIPSLSQKWMSRQQKALFAVFTVLGPWISDRLPDIKQRLPQHENSHYVSTTI